MSNVQHVTLINISTLIGLSISINVQNANGELSRCKRVVSTNKDGLFDMLINKNSQIRSNTFEDPKFQSLIAEIRGFGTLHAS